MNEQFVALAMEYAVKAAAFILSIAGLTLYAVIKGYLVAKVGAEKLATFQEMAMTTVRALEQEGLIRNLDGSAKYEIATLALRSLRDAMKASFITDPMIDTFIEAAVQILNTEAGKFTLPEAIEAT
jgi:hypothetical protein